MKQPHQVEILSVLFPVQKMATTFCIITWKQHNQFNKCKWQMLRRRMVGEVQHLQERLNERISSYPPLPFLLNLLRGVWLIVKSFIVLISIIQYFILAFCLYIRGLLALDLVLKWCLIVKEKLIKVYVYY